MPPNQQPDSDLTGTQNALTPPPLPVSEASAAQHGLIAEVEALAERFLGDRAYQIKAKLAELRALL